MTYSYHWAVKSPGATPGDADDYQALVDVSGTLFVRDTVLLYSSQCGKFPTLGPQQTLSGAWMSQHLSKVATHLNTYIPDVGFSGPVIIDYERWDLLWDRTGSEYKTAWRAYSGDNGSGDADAANKAGYEAAGRAFFEATYDRIKQLRPLAQVGFFGYPIKIYKAAAETAPGVIGYGEPGDAGYPYLASDRNDDLAWLFTLEDILVPNVYCLYRSVDDPQETYENTPAQDEEYVRSNVVEAVRVGAGKTVYAVICYLYQRSGTNPLTGVYLNDANFSHQLNTPAAAGASGVAIWGSVASAETAATVEAYLTAQAGGGGGDNGGGDNGGGGGGGGSGGSGSGGTTTTPRRRIGYRFVRVG